MNRIKMNLIRTIMILVPALMACQSPPSGPPDLSLRATSETTSPTPVSPLLYSHFIEIGFGYQIAPMQAERFFNRSFEPFPPYNGKSKNSFGFLLGGENYITDWGGEAWYHSGYEHNSWFAAPGEADDPAVITDHSTHFILESPDYDIQIKPMPDQGIHGRQCIRIINRETGRMGGIAQNGKWLEKGKTYHFTGFLRSVHGGNKSAGDLLDVDVKIFPEGEWDKELFSETVRISPEFERHSVQIPYDGPTGQVTFALFIPEGSTVEADAFSLLPEDHFFGWKPSTVAVVRKLNPGLIRFPGGCFASFYDWRRGIGPRNQRIPEPSYFWGGLNNNDLGTDEFAMLCQEVGCEMMMCVNIFHPNKERYLRDSRNPWQDIDYALPQFADLEKGIRSAADWVAYCNLPKGEHPMADLRARNGFPEPHRVTYWEMDNETARWMSAEEYAEVVVRYSRAMKAVDPGIKIGMVTYDFNDKVPSMLEIAGRHIDFFADRDDFGHERLDRMIGWLNDYNRVNKTSIKYCNTEWQVHPYGSRNPKEAVDERFLYGHRTAIKRAMVLGTWYCGLKAAGYLMEWQRRGDIVDFVNYNNFSNTHGQAVIETPKEGAYLTAPGRLYELISRTPARWPLVIEGYRPLRTDMLQGQVAYSLEKDRIVLFGLNRGDSAKTIEFDLSALNPDFRKIRFSMLDADDIFARTKLDLPDEIRRTDWTKKQIKEIVRMDCPPRSFIQAVLEW